MGGNGREEASLIAPSSDSSINVAKVETQEIFPDSTEDVTIGIKETTSQDDSKAAIDVKIKAEEEPKETNVQPEENLDSKDKLKNPRGRSRSHSKSAERKKDRA